MWLPDIDGLVERDSLDKTVDHIVDLQLDTGMIQWFPGGHADPWNHAEAVMALQVGGRRAEAERGFEWLLSTQRDDGAWHQYYLADRIEQDKLDANCVAYIAAAAWHHWLLFADRGFLESLWPAIDRAIEFVLDLQTPRGEILWARHADGTPWSFALLTGSSSICHSLRCAIAVARDARPRTARLGTVGRPARTRHPRRSRGLRSRSTAGRWTGTTRCSPGSSPAPMDEPASPSAGTPSSWTARGVRCVSDRPWVTAAETCECMMAHLAVGETERARQLFEWAQTLREPDGKYWTGIVYPEEVHFPGKEQSSYTAAAVILGADALAGESPASALFTHPDELLPELIDTHTDALSERTSE